MAEEMFYAASEIKSVFGIDIKEFDGAIHIGAWLNIDASELEEMVSEISFIDSFLQSPVD
jgi:hypothetical protein